MIPYNIATDRIRSVQAVDKPSNPKFSEGKGVCGETIRVSLRVQSDSFSNFLKV